MANKTAWGFSVKGEGSDTLEIDIYDIIGDDGWWGEGVTAKNVRAKLKAAKPATIKVRVNSAGGDVFDGFAIYNLLNEHTARVVVQVDALAASMASVIAMAGDEVVMASNAMLMIHNPWSFAVGDADDMRSQANMLDKVRGQIADVYVAKTSKPLSEVLAMMEAETWMTAEEAKVQGFADTIIANKANKSAKANASARAFASVNLDELAGAPADIRAAVEAARTAMKRPEQEQLTLPAIEARETPTQTKEHHSMKNIIMALGLPEDADEATIVAAIKKVQASGRVGIETEKIVGSAGDQAIGAVRALKESQSANAELVADLAKVKATMNRSEFDKARDKGFQDKKLTPALAKYYEGRFDAALVDGNDGSTIVAELQGFLAHAPRIAAFVARQPAGNGLVSEGSFTHNGKTFAQMSNVERARLSHSDPELYATMRGDWEEAGKPSAA